VWISLSKIMRGRLWLQCVEWSSKPYIMNLTIAEAYAV
jgi:hypothetical protein